MHFDLTERDRGLVRGERARDREAADSQGHHQAEVDGGGGSGPAHEAQGHAHRQGLSSKRVKYLPVLRSEKPALLKNPPFAMCSL